jgi:hypothetical protein
MVYSEPIERVAGGFCGPGHPNPIALFVHYEGQSSSDQLNASPSQCQSPSPCASVGAATPAFDGLSPDGKRAWYTTSQPLINSDKDSSGDLYLAELDEGHVSQLVQASLGEASPDHPSPGENADVLGEVRMSADGSHVAFVATGVLTTDPNGLGQAANLGGDNLYIYDANTAETHFVAALCSGAGLSGSVHDDACVGDGSGLWVTNENDGVPHATFTPAGRYLLLENSAQLTPDDTDNVPDIFRYDFNTGQLIRVTFGRNGNDGNGNDDRFFAEVPGERRGGGVAEGNHLAEDSGRLISADGSIVIFETAAALVSKDTNGKGPHPGCGSYHEGEAEGESTGCDIYEWEEQGHGTCHEAGGCISLISDGVDQFGDHFGIISSSGNDIVFQSQRGEVPGDTDGVGDIYDARVDGGFPPVHPQSPCGSPEACRAAAETAPPGPVLGTQSFAGAGNSSGHLRCAKGKIRVRKHGQPRCVAARHRHRRREKHSTRHQGRRSGGRRNSERGPR